MLTPEFWYNVLSNTIATIIGIVLGIPAALWINRRAEAGNDAKQKAGEIRVRRLSALRVLSSLRVEIAANRDLLASLIKELQVRDCRIT